jgi:hypothetical protein
MALDSIFDVIKLLISALKEQKKARKALLIFVPIALITSLFFLFIFPFEQSAIEKDILSIISISCGVLLFLVLASFTNIKTDSEILVANLNTIKEEREKIIEKIGNDSVVNTIQLSLNQLTEYYTINLSQARTSYRWSVTAIIVGLITLIVGAWLLFFQANPNVSVAIITGISGVLIEFIGASNIYIYNKSLSQLNLYFKELINIQDTMLAIELCEKIDSSQDRKIDITEKIILNLINRNIKIDD